MEVSYKIFNPAGNITALVIGDEYNLEQRRLINNLIMKKETEVEQVGFISQNKRKLTKKPSRVKHGVFYFFFLRVLFLRKKLIFSSFAQPFTCPPIPN